MIPGLILTLSLALSATPAEALTAAEKHLAEGKLDEVFFAVEGQKFTGDDAKRATMLLTRAGKLSIDKKDPILAIEFAQSALELEPKTMAAHEVLARAYKSQQQFGPAEEHADRWLALANDAGGIEPAPLVTPPQVIAARLFRGQLALEQGDWELALAMGNALQTERLEGEDAQLAALIRRQAQKELSERSAGLSTARSLEEKLEHALADAKRLDARGRRASAGAPLEASSSGGVVLYRTSWCGYCDRAKALLRKLRVRFVEKDIEKDPAASQELARKAARAGVQPRGVPVLDIHGKLVLGFNEKRIRELVR